MTDIVIRIMWPSGHKPVFAIAYRGGPLIEQYESAGEAREALLQLRGANDNQKEEK